MKISIRNNKYGCSETVKPIPYIYDNSFDFMNISIVKKNKNVIYVIDDHGFNIITRKYTQDYIVNPKKYTVIFELYFAILITETTAYIFDKYGNILTSCDINLCQTKFYDILDMCIPKLIRKEKIKSFLV